MAELYGSKTNGFKPSDDTDSGLQIGPKMKNDRSETIPSNFDQTLYLADRLRIGPIQKVSNRNFQWREENARRSCTF